MFITRRRLNAVARNAVASNELPELTHEQQLALLEIASFGGTTAKGALSRAMLARRSRHQPPGRGAAPDRVDASQRNTTGSLASLAGAHLRRCPLREVVLGNAGDCQTSR